MQKFVEKHLRAGLMAGSLCLALVLGALAQSTKPQSEPAQPSSPQAAPAQTEPTPSAPSQASPAPTAPGQTLPDQDNGVRPTPDKDNAAQQPANPAGQDQDRDRDRDHSSMSQSSQSSDMSINRKDIKEFNQFLDKHPDIAQDLQKDPQKVNDSTYISSHPELSKWLDKHSNIREELKANPSAFVNSQTKGEKNEKPMSEKPR
jgi:hypothetical protein